MAAFFSGRKDRFDCTKVHVDTGEEPVTTSLSSSSKFLQVWCQLSLSKVREKTKTKRSLQWNDGERTFLSR